MYKKNIMNNTSLEINESVQGETIETKIERVLNNGEPIEDSAPTIYTERKDGVIPAYDIRTDRFEIAIDAMDKVSGSHQAKREDRAEQREAKIVQMNKNKDGGAESTQG